MVQNVESREGETISEGVWSVELFKHIEYFNSNRNFEELKIMLPFGLLRQREPKNYKKNEIEKLKRETLKRQARMLRENKMGMFYKEPEIEIKPWKPKQSLVVETQNFSKYKPTKFILRNDHDSKKVMFLEQDLMAKPITKNIDERTGFSYRLNTDKNVIIRKFIVMVNQKNFLKMVHEFIEECNRVLYLYCDTI